MAATADQSYQCQLPSPESINTESHTPMPRDSSPPAQSRQDSAVQLPDWIPFAHLDSEDGQEQSRHPRIALPSHIRATLESERKREIDAIFQRLQLDKESVDRPRALCSLSKFEPLRRGVLSGLHFLLMQETSRLDSLHVDEQLMRCAKLLREYTDALRDMEYIAARPPVEILCASSDFTRAAKTDHTLAAILEQMQRPMPADKLSRWKFVHKIPGRRVLHYLYGKDAVVTRFVDFVRAGDVEVQAEARALLKKEVKFAVQRIRVAMLGALAIIIPMLIIAIKASLLKSLVTSCVSVILFGLLTGWNAQESSNAEILAVTTAYGAVLMVFVGELMGEQ